MLPYPLLDKCRKCHILENKTYRKSHFWSSAGWFCFVQTGDGKVVAVQHSPRESQNTFDFKRAIAAAFQANFKGTSEETKSDPSQLTCLTTRNVALYSIDTSKFSFA